MITQDLIRKLFSYRGGLLYWRESPRYRIPAGSVAGSINHTGYRFIKISRKFYKASRLVWIYHFGDIPKGLQVDHVNRNKLNDQIENLRLVNRSQNTMNQRERRDNTSGHRGVTWNKRKKRWHARIEVNGKRKSLGYFSKIEEARIARQSAEILLFGEYSPDFNTEEQHDYHPAA